jgi:uncharacterized protein YbaP (TraB family)
VLQQLAFFPPEDSLANHLPAELLGRLPALGQRYHLPMERMLRMRAWLLAQTFEVLELQRAGLSGGDGVEVILANFARQRQIPVLEIEGFTAQIELLRKEPEDVQRDELQESIDEIEDGEAAAQAEMLLSGWATGDEAAVEAEIAELRAQDSPFSRYMLTEILEARDTTMTDRAEAFLEEGGVTFFAVGALHLFSDAGLIAQLRRRGYRVENLQSSAGPSAGGAAP